MDKFNGSRNMSYIRVRLSTPTVSDIVLSSLFSELCEAQVLSWKNNKAFILKLNTTMVLSRLELSWHGRWKVLWWRYMTEPVHVIKDSQVSVLRRPPLLAKLPHVFLWIPLILHGDWWKDWPGRVATRWRRLHRSSRRLQTTSPSLAKWLIHWRLRQWSTKFPSSQLFRYLIGDRFFCEWPDPFHG